MKKIAKKKVYAYLHTHWDREWYRDFEEFRIRLVEVFDDVLNKLGTNEIPSFYFDGQTCALQDYFEIRPERKDIVEKFIKEKRLFIGPYYCSTDSFLVDAESLIKNLQMGLRYSKEFGCQDYLAYHADTFGHSKHICQIVKYFKIPNACFWRGLGELDSEFLLNSLKSTYLIEGYFHDYFSAPVSYEKKAEFLKRTLDRIAKYSSDSILLPLGADHLACPDNIKKQIEEVNKLLDDYEIILSTPFEYMEKVDNNYKKNLYQEFRDTKRNFILPGVYSSRIDLKQQNAKLQFELSRVTQPLQAIGAYLGLCKNYQSEIDSAYKTLINNHPHDSIYGCSVDNVHTENKQRFLNVSEASRSVFNCVKRDMYDENSLSLINFSNFKFNGAIKIQTTKKLDKKYNAQLVSKSKGFPFLKLYDIKQIPITEDYTTIYEYLVDIKSSEPFSLKKLEKENIEANSSLKVSENFIENDKISLQVLNGKIVVTDKITNKIYHDFLKFKDRADIGDSYNFGALKNDKPLYSEIIKTKIKEKGHIRSILEVVFEIGIPSKSKDNGRAKQVKKHILKLNAILENQNDFIEFNLEWKNKSTDHILQAEFNLSDNVSETVSDDLAGYVTRKFDYNYDIYEHIPAPRGIELKNNTAPMQKLVWTQGLALVTEGLQEYEVFKDKLSLTLLRATGTISNPKNPCRGTPAGPPLPTPDLQMIGNNSARFAIYFKDKIEEAEPSVEKFYGTAFLLNADLEDVKLFDSGNKNIIVSTIKSNKNNDLIIRFLNKSDISQELKFHTNLQNDGIFFTDAMENISEKYFDKQIPANSFETILLRKN